MMSLSDHGKMALSGRSDGWELFSAIPQPPEAIEVPL